MKAAKQVLLVLETDPAVRDSLKFSLEAEGVEVVRHIRLNASNRLLFLAF